jgi:leucyl/phenylalanyl-tRNA--protein transferase
MPEKLTPALLLRAYGAGIFPMAESRGSLDIHWIDPSQRGIIPLDGFHISRSLRKTILKERFQARFDTDFQAVLLGCADRSETWINAEIRQLYLGLFEMGHAHSQEIWDGNELIGGVYGVTLGRAFFGESMFSHRRNGSKIALAWLVHRLQETGFQLFDTQFLTPHLQSLGAIELTRANYLQRLDTALGETANIAALRAPITAHDVIQRSTQTS